MGPINGWHEGERSIQQKMGYAGVMSQAWTRIAPEMPEEHQVFYTTRLPFIPVTTIDDKQRPWSSILAGPDGQPGFATSRHAGELTLNAHVWEGDPFPQNVAAASSGGPVLIAGIGVEFSTRRRNKFAGYIETLETDGPTLRVRSVVNEAIGYVSQNHWNHHAHTGMIEIAQSTSTCEISCRSRTLIRTSYIDVSTWPLTSDCPMTLYRLSIAQIRFSWGLTMTLGNMVNDFRRTWA